MNSNKVCFVLIRGLFRDQRHWGNFIPIMENQFPDADIIALDIPGNGQLNHQTSPSTIAGITDALRQQLPNRTNLNLMGISMGGMVTVDWMIRYPNEINSAILINTSLRPFSPFFQRLRWQIYPTILKMILSPAAKNESHFLSLTSNNHYNDTHLLSSWIEWKKQKPVSTLSAINQMLAILKFSVNTKPQHPILVVTTKNDHMVDYRCSLKLHQVWQADYQQHDKAGHDLPLDNPEWLAQVIHRWVN